MVDLDDLVGLNDPAEVVLEHLVVHVVDVGLDDDVVAELGLVLLERRLELGERPRDVGLGDCLHRLEA